MTGTDHAFLSRREFVQASALALIALRSDLALGAPGAAAAEGTGAGYVVKRLAQHGADILFGVPGATCDPLFAAAAHADDMDIVVTASDLEAGYAADGFARGKGLSALSLSYGVGTMSAITVVAGAYAERSPMVVINGGPSPTDLRLQRRNHTYFSHSTGREASDLVMFREVTAFAERAESAADIPRVVDGAIGHALGRQRPVYIEIPKQLWHAKVATPRGIITAGEVPSGREGQLAGEILGRLASAKRPVLMLGAEIARYGHQRAAAELMAKLRVPYTTTMLAKAVIPETTEGFAGVYAGTRSVPAVRELVEQSDALLALGTVFGRQYRAAAKRARSHGMVASDASVRLGAKSAGDVSLGALLDALNQATYSPVVAHAANNPLKGRTFEERRTSLPGAATRSRGKSLTYDSVLSTVSAQLDATHVVLTDTSLSMYPAADLNIPAGAGFVCNGVWQAIGFSVGTALGVALATGKRPVVICGDGGFQMTAQSLSTMVKARMKAIVIVLDNGHYAIEQFLLDRDYFAGKSKALPYLGLNRWSYPDFAKSLGFEIARTVTSTAGLRKALAEARSAKGPVLLSATLDPQDLPHQLRS